MMARGTTTAGFYLAAPLLLSLVSRSQFLSSKNSSGFFARLCPRIFFFFFLLLLDDKNIYSLALMSLSSISPRFVGHKNRH